MRGFTVLIHVLGNCSMHARLRPRSTPPKSPLRYYRLWHVSWATPGGWGAGTGWGVGAWLCWVVWGGCGVLWYICFSLASVMLFPCVCVRVLEHVTTLQFLSASELYLLLREVHPENVSCADICTGHVQSTLPQVKVPFWVSHRRVCRPGVYVSYVSITVWLRHHKFVVYFGKTQLNN